MIERKDIEHTLDGHDMRFDSYSQVNSELRLSIDTSIKDDKRDEAKRHNEEVIRLKLYMEIEDELNEIKQEIYLNYSQKWIVERIKRLINKLKWVE